MSDQTGLSKKEEGADVIVIIVLKRKRIKTHRAAAQSTCCRLKEEPAPADPQTSSQLQTFLSSLAQTVRTSCRASQTPESARKTTPELPRLSRTRPLLLGAPTSGSHVRLHLQNKSQGKLLSRARSPKTTWGRRFPSKLQEYKELITAGD